MDQKRKSLVKRLLPAVLASFACVLASTPGQSWAVTTSGPFHFRENVGPNSLGISPGDLQLFGAITVLPSGPPTTVTATQGTVVVPLDFFPITLFPDEYLTRIPFNPALTGSWTINATRDAESAAPVNTNPILNPQLLPLLQNLRVVNGNLAPLTPTLTWELPDLSAFTVTRIRVRIADAVTRDSFFDAFLSRTATVFTIPAGLLQFGRTYAFRVMLEDTSPGFLQARSSTFSSSYTPAVLTISGLFHFRENVGPNDFGFGSGDLQVFGAITVLPSGPPTTVTATQGTVVVPLDFLPVTLFPDEYLTRIPFNPGLTGPWTINATRDAQSAAPVNTNPIPNPQLLPLVQNLRVVNGNLTPLTPTLTWELPNLSAFTVTRIRVRIADAVTRDSFFDAFLSRTATVFTIPAGLLQFGRTYAFRVMLEDTSPGFLQARSTTFSSPYAPVTLSISGPFHFRENVGPNDFGFASGDLQAFGAITVLPSGPPTTVTATQGTVVVPLSFLPVTLFPDEYLARIPFNPTLTGSWTINATRDAESAAPVNTNPLPNPQLLPLLQNLRVVNGDLAPLTPTLTWELPDLGAFTVTRIRVRIVDAVTRDSFFDAFLSRTATAFTIPAGLLQFGRTYTFRVMLEDTSPGFLQARSSTFSSGYAPRSTVAGIDQEQPIIDSSVGGLAIGGGSQQKLAQVVTPGATGLLTEVRLPVACDPGSTLILEIQGVVGAMPDGQVRASQAIAGASLPSFFPSPPAFRSLVFTTPPQVTAGNPFAFVLRSNEACGLFQGPVGNAYAGGDGFFDARPNPPGWVPLGPPRSDLPFQTVVGGHPVANAGPDQRASEGTAVGLDGSASTGPGLSFQWTQVAGPAVSLAGATTQTPTFTAPPLPGGFGSQILTFQLTVSNSAGSNSDSVDVLVSNVNHAPEPHAGGEQTVKEGSLVILDGRASFDPDGDPLTYRWLQVTGLPVALAEAETSTPSFTAPILSGGLNGQEVLTFALTVSDGALSQTDEVRVVVEQLDHPPVADAGMPQTVHTGRLVTLDGSRSGDPDADPIFFTWSQVGGPAVELINATTPTPSFSAPAASGPTNLRFRLIVGDTQLDSAPADVVITVVNDRPLCQLARAVPDRLWPPDHRMVPIAITGVTDPDDDTVTIQILAVTQDEPATGLSDGDTSPDALMRDGIPLLRAERSGVGNGRVYHVSFVADDRLGGRCSGEVQVGVPKSMEPGAPIIDDGRLYDSSLP